MSEGRSLPGDRCRKGWQSVTETKRAQGLERDGVRSTVQRLAGALDGTAARKALPVLQLAAAMVAWGLWYQDFSRGWVLAIALLPVIPDLISRRILARRSPLDALIIAFTLAALLGVWAAYDRAGRQVVFPQFMPVGWQALWGLVLAAIVFYALSQTQTETQQRWALALFAGLGAAIAAWFAAANDWQAHLAKLVQVTWLGKVLQEWLPALPGRWPNVNVIGGMLAILLPSSLGLTFEGGMRPAGRQRPWLIWGLVTGAGILVGLVLTTSRGAWMGVAGSLALGTVWWLAGRFVSRARGSRVLMWVGAGVLAAGALAALMLFLGADLPENWMLSNRPGIFGESLLLVRDYPFTGFGPGEFALVHSTYALMIHVPILPYAHSLFLDIALGQGVLGIVSAIGVLGGALRLGLRTLARAKARPSPMLVAGLLSLVTMILHGLVDDALYSGLGMPLLWASAGMVVAGSRQVAVAHVSPVRLRTRYGLGAAAVTGLVLLGLFWRPVLAAWYANLGAVYQTRTELSRYNYGRFDDPTLDEIRRQVDLSAAERLFSRAVTLVPGQVTARTRLAEIALSRGQYGQALAHARAAWEAGHRDRVTRLVLGDALVANGDVEAAIEVVRGLEWAEGRLDGQAWYRYWLGEDYRRAADAWRAVVGLDPQNERAAGAAQAAEARAAQP